MILYYIKMQIKKIIDLKIILYKMRMGEIMGDNNN